MGNKKSIEIQEHINVFHNLLIDILRRRELFRVFEGRLIGRARKETVIENWFISFYITDYTRNQIVDLRKFFETDTKSYKISFLTDYLNNKTQKNAHTKLFSYWKSKFESQANQMIMHLDQNSRNLPNNISKKELDSLIDSINNFFDDLVQSFTNEGHKIDFDKKYRDMKNDFLRKTAESKFDEYLKMLSSKFIKE